MSARESPGDGTFRRRIRESTEALSEVFRNDDLRRLQIAGAGSVTAEWGYTVGLAVYAYDFGGAAWVGIVGLIRMLPSAVAAPLGSIILDRYPRQRVLVILYAFLCVSLAISGAAALGHLPGLVFVTATILTVASSILRPAEWSLRPLLSETPEQLAACNVASSMIEGVSVFVGPALAGLLLTGTNPGVVFVGAAQVYWLAALFAARIRTAERAREVSAGGGPAPGGPLSGLRAVAANRDPRLLVVLFGAQTFVRGALNVLVVVSAIELLRLGDPGVGYLNSAFGVGNLVGAIAALALVGRRRLAGPFGFGLAVWGAPIALVGVWPHPAAAIVLLALPGFGNGVLDVAGLTLIQRTTPDAILGRVFGVLNGMVLATVAAGAIATPAVIHGMGVRGALVVFGALLPALALLAWKRLQAIDAKVILPETELRLLRESRIFAPLPPVALEKIASRLFPVNVLAAKPVFHQGDPGDLFFIVAEGEFEVERDGVVTAVITPGGSFGEIALLRDVPRTATVRAVTDGVLYTLDRGTFILAVAGHREAASAADALVAERLAPASSGRNRLDPVRKAPSGRAETGPASRNRAARSLDSTSK